jgi:hypothetical protein
MKRAIQSIVALLAVAAAGPAQAQAWSSMVGACASTDNNFSNRTASSDYPIARYATPGGSFTFNAFHDGYIAMHCPVSPPSTGSTTWNRLHVSYKDADALQGLGGSGTTYQAVAELVRMSKADGSLSRVAIFDSNLQCQGLANCQATDIVKTYSLPFTHTFDFANYTYAVYTRLYRGLTFFRPALFQVRLQTND